MSGNRLRRGLLAISAVLLVAASALHTVAYPGLVRQLDDVQLKPFYDASYRVLWLSDSFILLVVGIVLATGAARPGFVTRAAVALLALIPAVTAMLLYSRLGAFPPAHVLLAAGLSALASSAMPTPESLSGAPSR